jgi:hypothetical protein
VCQAPQMSVYPLNTPGGGGQSLALPDTSSDHATIAGDVARSHTPTPGPYLSESESASRIVYMLLVLGYSLAGPVSEIARPVMPFQPAPR